MLREITCEFFAQKTIVFHRGLNVVLGDDNAKNSIGKSTALMVIDFVHGGDTFLEDKSGAIRELGHHSYNFEFLFENLAFYFSRSTDRSEVVSVCDKNYNHLEEISVGDYRRKLKDLYELKSVESSFRSIVGPFSRIWGKGGLEPDQPFVGDVHESAETAIGRLIDLFGMARDIVVEKGLIDEKKNRKKILAKSMSVNIVPGINKTKYRENLGTINHNRAQIEGLKNGFSGAIATYETLVDEDLRAKQSRRNELGRMRAEIQIRIKRLEREISGITPRLAANIALISDFFPTINVEKIAAVESFHQKIGRIVKKELKDELSSAKDAELQLDSEILSIDESVHAALDAKGLPDDVFKRVFELKEKTDKAVEENDFFDKRVQLNEAIKLSEERLSTIYAKIFLNIESKINAKLRAFTRVVYGPNRSSSELRIERQNSYKFLSSDDTGTGKSFAGLIGFDLAILSLTNVPFFIHDSVIYKNIEIEATENILRILSRINGKQVFLSFDEAKKYDDRAKGILSTSAVLRLSRDRLLYQKDWRDKKDL
jgi:hypothetical protein